MKHRAVFSTILFFMKSQTLKKFILCALLATCPFLVLADEWQTLRGCTFVPNEWNDGDSFHVRHQGQEYIFRLYFADTPESEDSLPERVAEQAEHFGITPTQSVQAGISAKKETARFLDAPFTVITRFQAAPGRSKMTRFYAFVIPSPARKDLASLLIEAGMARSFGTVAKNDLGLDRQHYDMLEGRARRQGLGFYSTKNLSVETPKSSNTLPALASQEVEPVDVISKTNSELNDESFENLQKEINRTPQLFSPEPVKKLSESTQSPEVKEQQQSGKINVNKASAEELQSLPGIGEVIAENIRKNRPYANLADLALVPKIGPVTLKKITPFIEFE
ncbi:MAG: helix-hairpin-helix domain-containing protein [Verrucomicrobia bacterium]|nr:helix-hairpin-helix domain-containing protein [Verrucomicrobiota bacterium]